MAERGEGEGHALLLAELRGGTALSLCINSRGAGGERTPAYVCMRETATIYMHYNATQLGSNESPVNEI